MNCKPQVTYNEKLSYFIISCFYVHGAYNGYGQKQPSDYHLQKAIDLMQNNGDEKKWWNASTNSFKKLPTMPMQG